MQDRIRELAEEVYGSAHHDDFRFAELIVRECAQVARASHKYGNPMARMVVRIAAAAIRRHFGVRARARPGH